MRNKNTTNQKQTASIKALLLIFTLAAVAFFGGYYLAVAHIAAMLVK